MYRVIAVLLILSVFFVSCKKTEELPDPTQTGAHTFGAKVDGELWAPAGFGPFQTAPLIEARYLVNRNLIIQARNFSRSPTETEMEIFIKNVVAPGVYQLNESTGKYPGQVANYGYYVRRVFTPKDEYITNPQFTGEVVVTRADTVNHIISGTFQFRAMNVVDSTTSVVVTEGRFDVKAL